MIVPIYILINLLILLSVVSVMLVIISLGAVYGVQTYSCSNEHRSCHCKSEKDLKTAKKILTLIQK